MVRVWASYNQLFSIQLNTNCRYNCLCYQKNGAKKWQKLLKVWAIVTCTRVFNCPQTVTSWLLGFDSLQKAFVKAKAVIDKEPETPRFYIRALMELEDFVKEVSFCVTSKDVFADVRHTSNIVSRFCVMGGYDNTVSVISCCYCNKAHVMLSATVYYTRCCAYVHTCFYILQLWEDKEAKAKLNKVNSKVC